RRDERIEIDVRGRRREPSERQPRAPDHVLPLTERNRREQPAALTGGQPPSGAPRPAKAAKSLRIGRAPGAVSVLARGAHPPMLVAPSRILRKVFPSEFRVHAELLGVALVSLGPGIERVGLAHRLTFK